QRISEAHSLLTRTGPILGNPFRVLERHEQPAAGFNAKAVGIPLAIQYEAVGQPPFNEAAMDRRRHMFIRIDQQQAPTVIHPADRSYRRQGAGQPSQPPTYRQGPLFSRHGLWVWRIRKRRQTVDPPTAAFAAEWQGVLEVLHAGVPTGETRKARASQ